MTRRTVPPLLAAALFLAACTSPPTAEIDLSADFVPFVADSTDNVGLGNSIAVTEDGTPYIAYFGFPSEVAEGEIAPIRPVGAAFIPAVQLASVNLAGDEGVGIWSRGAVAQAEEFSGVTVPFGPEVVESLARLTPESATGTSIALDGAGAPHVAWASNTGIWYASSGESSSVAQVARSDAAQAGPIGRPGIAMDGSTPWVAWTAAGPTSLEVHVATTDADGAWTDTVVAEAEPCRGCPAPAPTGIEVSGSGPVVVFADQAAGAVMSARLEGETWTTATVDPRAAGDGLSTTTDGNGDVLVSYFDGVGGVVLAIGDGGSWTTTDVGEAAEGGGDDGAAVPTTGVAADGQGTVSVTWDDPANDTVRLAQRSDGSFEEVEVPASSGGRSPSVAATPDGERVYLAWYDSTTQDLLMGILGGVEGLLLANPSPAQEPVAGGGGAATCEPEGTEIVLVALEQTWESTTCIAVEAATDFNVTVENPSSAVHDFSIFPSASEVTEQDALFYSFTDPVQPGANITYPVPGIEEPGDYFFRCDYHPTTMTGTFIVAEA